MSEGIFNILLVIILLFASVGFVDTIVRIKARWVFPKKAKGDWNSFEGFKSESDQVKETLDRR